MKQILLTVQSCIVTLLLFVLPIVQGYSANHHHYLRSSLTKLSSGRTRISTGTISSSSGGGGGITTRDDDVISSSSWKNNSDAGSLKSISGTNPSRKDFLSFIVTASSLASTTMVLKPSQASAAETNNNDVADNGTADTTNTNTPTKFTSAQIQKFLQPIPTFAIVDKSGTPYMVVGEDAKLSAYFFTSYEEAERILKIASKSSQKALQEAKLEENTKRRARGEKPLASQEEVEDAIGINPWVGARISSVPLDFASGLAFKGKVRGAYFRIAPAEKDVQDALILDKLEDLAEGKVPLFYVEDFEIGLKDGEELWSDDNVSGGVDIGGEKRTKIPLYFSKEQLIKDWKKFNPTRRQGKQNDDVPEVKVTELFSLLTEMVTGQQGTKDELAKLVLVPPVDSQIKAKACLKRGGNESPYKLGERIIAL